MRRVQSRGGRGMFSARRKLPPRVRTAAPGRVLSAAETSNGTWLVGTRDALVVVPAGQERLLVPWEQVQRADWDLESSTLRVEPVRDYGEPLAPLSFDLDEPGALLQLVRERVSASVVVQRRVDLGSKRGLVVIGRRAPSRPGQITWAYELDAGVDPADPEVMTAAENGLRDARESLGL